MDPTPFNPETDLPPIPFDERHCRIAAALKDAGLPWRPHVGCFVWDRDEVIEASSPFPGRIYLILNLGHFLRIFDSVENITKRLVWLPTWHQARLLCDQLGVDQKDISKFWQCFGEIKAGDELIGIYEILLKRLQEKARAG
jgi:hypothetical protein